MTDNNQDNAGLHLRGGPQKIQGVQQSAAEAQAARDKSPAEQQGPYGGGDDDPSSNASTGSSFHPRGGPSKIRGVQQSAADAEAAREGSVDQSGDDFARDGDEDEADDSAVGGSAGGLHLNLRGGPGKIAGIRQSAADAQRRREELDQGARDSGYSGHQDGRDAASDERAGLGLKGGPGKISGIARSAADAQVARERAADDEDEAC